MKTAQALLVMVLLYVPAGVRASGTDFAYNVWGYPNRAAEEIFSWFGSNTKNTLSSSPQVLGAEDLSQRPVVEDSVIYPNLDTKLDSTRASIEKLSSDYQQVLSESILIGLKWDELTVSDVTQSIDKQNAVLSSTSDALDWLSRAWGWSQLDTLRIKLNNIKVNLATVRSIASQSGMLPVAYDQLKSTAKELDLLVSEIGTATDLVKQNTLFGRYNQVHEASLQWDDLRLQLESPDVNLSRAMAQILDLNLIPNVSSVLSKDADNKKLGLMAIIQANKTLMSVDRGIAITSTWLEESATNTIVFRTLVANPSLLARKEVAVKYYLPLELSEDKIISHDSDVEIKLDPDRKQLFVAGKIMVAAGDTRNINVETSDVWYFDNALIESTRSQMSDIIDSLANAPQLAKVVALKATIESQLKEVENLQNQVQTPVVRIIAHRRVQSQMREVANELAQMKQLAATTGRQPWQTAGWQDLVLSIGGIMLVVMGLSILNDPRVKFEWIRKINPDTGNFTVFSGGIATSDL